MNRRLTTAPTAGIAVGEARLRSGPTAPACMWHLGGSQGTTSFAGRQNTDVPYNRWRLELSP